MGVGVGLTVGVALGGELLTEGLGVGWAEILGTGSALPTHPAAENISAPEHNRNMTFFSFVSMPAAYDSVGVN